MQPVHAAFLSCPLHPLGQSRCFLKIAMKSPFLPAQCWGPLSSLASSSSTSLPWPSLHLPRSRPWSPRWRCHFPVCIPGGGTCFLSCCWLPPPPRSPHLQESFSHTCAQWSPNCDSGSQECHLLDVSSQFPRDKEGDLGAEPSLSSGTESCFPPAPSHGGKVWKFIVGSLACEVYIQ